MLPGLFEGARSWLERLVERIRHDDDEEEKEKNNNNFTTRICLAISVRAKVLRDPLVQYSRGLNPAQIDMAILTPSLTIPEQTELAALARGGAVLKLHLSCSPITTHWDN